MHTVSNELKNKENVAREFEYNRCFVKVNFLLDTLGIWLI